MKPHLLAAMAAVALACTSCRNSNGLYPVSGRVTYNGDPAVGATVFLYRRGADRVNEHMIMGIVQEDGSFTLVCGALGAGAPPGEYDVLIQWRQGSPRSRGPAEKAPDRLQGRYADPARPLFSAVVKAATNHLPPFELMD